MGELIPRHVTPLATDLLNHRPGLVIEGARQVGKSTLAGQLVAGRPAVIANLDRQATREAALADPEGFVRQAGEGTLVIDEIQQAPELTLAVKTAIDEERRPGRFLLTGSATLLHVRGLVDSLAGRVGRLALFGLSRGELAGRRDDFAAELHDLFTVHPSRDVDTTITRHSSPLSRGDYATLVTQGSYPELHTLPERLRPGWIDDYLHDLVGRDLTQLRRSVDPTRAMALLRAMAGNQAGELVKARVAHDVDIPASTITGYLDLLVDVGLVTLLPPWTPNLVKREVGRPKGLVIDSALAARLSRLTLGQLSQLEYGEALGKLLEGFVVAELLRQQTWSEQEFTLFHFRDRAGAEIDLILEYADGRVLALEIKASSSFSGRGFRGLARLRDLLGKRFLAGVVLNTGSQGYRYAPSLYGLPISTLWEGLGHG